MARARSMAIAGLTAMAVTPSLAATGYANPASGGGSMLANNIGSSTGEPINVIISGSSDSAVLTSSGFLAYMQSIDLSGECLGFSEEASLQANLGDGQGDKNATATLRYNFGNAGTGTCKETADGGNHLRYWQQSGRQANTSAWFLAASVEQNLTQGHNIVPGGAGQNGYDLGRDWLAGNATAQSTSALGYSFTTTANNVSGLLQSGSSGINHGLSIDGIVTASISCRESLLVAHVEIAQVLTVRATTVPSNSTGSSSASAASPSSSNIATEQQQISAATTLVGRRFACMLSLLAFVAAATLL